MLVWLLPYVLPRLTLLLLLPSLLAWLLPNNLPRHAGLVVPVGHAGVLALAAPVGQAGLVVFVGLVAAPCSA